MSLAALIDDPAADVATIAAYLDGRAAEARWREVGSLGRAAQRRLYDKAGRGAPITFDHFLDGVRGEVIHDGQNTLPVPAPFRRFQKRFCPGGPDRLFGYNEGPTRRVIGPGYFVAVPTAGNPAWQARGAIVIDYYQVPDGPVPGSWPRVRPNSSGLQRLVYHQTRDFMRRVSAHVSIGAAFKGERALDHYFVLCRR